MAESINFSEKSRVDNTKEKELLSFENHKDEVVYGVMANMSNNQVQELLAEKEKNDNSKINSGIIVKLVIMTVLAALICISIAIWSSVNSFKNDLEENEVINNKVDEEKVLSQETKEKKGYRTIAFYGLDGGKKDGDNRRSDTIILCNINEDTGEVKLASVYRDLYAYIENYDDYSTKMLGKKSTKEYTKINAAYKVSPEEALLCLNQNFALRITDYVAVDFTTVAKVVDALGGIEVTLPDKNNFIFWLNGAGYEAAYLNKEKYVPLSESLKGQTVTLNGYQALGYCRVRKPSQPALKNSRPLVDESDFTRSERQKEVISLITEKAKHDGLSSVGKLMSICTNSENMKTSLSWDELKGLATKVIKEEYTLSTEEKISFPENIMTKQVEGQWYDFCEGDFVDEVRTLHEKLYPDIELTEDELVKVKEIGEVVDEYKTRPASN